MRIYWTRIKADNIRYVYYFKDEEGKMTAAVSKVINKKRRPEYIFLRSIPYRCDINFSKSRFFIKKL